MRKISFQEQNQKRKKAKIALLNIKDNLSQEKNGTLLERDKEKRRLLYKLAQEKKGKLFKKIGQRKYRARGD